MGPPCLNSGMGPLATLYIHVTGISLIHSGLLAWDQSHMIHEDGEYVQYMHFASWIGPLALLYIHFAGISLIYSVLLACDHSLYDPCILIEYA